MEQRVQRATPFSTPYIRPIVLEAKVDPELVTSADVVFEAVHDNAYRAHDFTEALLAHLYEASRADLIPDVFAQTPSCAAHWKALTDLLQTTHFALQAYARIPALRNGDHVRIRVAVAHALGTWWTWYTGTRYRQDVERKHDAHAFDLARFMQQSEEAKRRRETTVHKTVRNLVWSTMTLARRILRTHTPDLPPRPAGMRCADYFEGSGTTQPAWCTTVPWPGLEEDDDGGAASAVYNAESVMTRSQHAIDAAERGLGEPRVADNSDTTPWACPRTLAHCPIKTLTTQQLGAMVRHLHDEWHRPMAHIQIDALALALWDRMGDLLFDDDVPASAFDDYQNTKRPPGGVPILRKRLILELEGVLVRLLHRAHFLARWRRRAAATAPVWLARAGVLPEGTWVVPSARNTSGIARVPRLLQEPARLADEWCAVIDAIARTQEYDALVRRPVREVMLGTLLRGAEMEHLRDIRRDAEPVPGVAIKELRPTEYETAIELTFSHDLVPRIAALCHGAAMDPGDPVARAIAETGLTATEVQSSLPNTRVYARVALPMVSRVITRILSPRPANPEHALTQRLYLAHESLSHTTSRAPNVLPTIWTLNGDYAVIADATDRFGAMCIVTPRFVHALYVWCAAMLFRGFDLVDDLLMRIVEPLIPLMNHLCKCREEAW